MWGVRDHGSPTFSAKNATHVITALLVNTGKSKKLPPKFRHQWHRLVRMALKQWILKVEVGAIKKKKILPNPLRLQFFKTNTGYSLNSYILKKKHNNNNKLPKGFCSSLQDLDVMCPETHSTLLYAAPDSECHSDWLGPCQHTYSFRVILHCFSAT